MDNAKSRLLVLAEALKDKGYQCLPDTAIEASRYVDNLERDLAALREELAGTKSYLDWCKNSHAITKGNLEASRESIERILHNLQWRVKPLEALLDSANAPWDTDGSHLNPYIIDDAGVSVHLYHLVSAINAFASPAPAQSGEGGA
jgi:hypothetical protein